MVFSSSIIIWYQENKRVLPWRETIDPYKIWLSEIILQQTRVSQGLPYYLAFIEQFPTVETLAKAKEQQVLRLWQGLGYYSRARNLHRCAKVVVDTLGGHFPSTFQELQKLPGVGPYTAAAIASIAFREPVAVVDGNVFRVLARIFGIETDIASNEAKRVFFSKANELISKDQPDIFNQAMMEFGATWCTPKNPKCDECIFKKRCVAFQRDRIDELPVKLKKTKVRKRYFHYFIIESEKKILMKKREHKDIWQGLYDFYLVEGKRAQNVKTLIAEDEFLSRFRKKEIKKLETVRHILSHQRLSVDFIYLKVEEAAKKFSPPSGFKFYSAKQITALPKPIIITRLFEERIFIK